MTEPTTLYKVLVDGKPCHGGSQDFHWPLPAGDQPGEWVSVPGPLQICEHGLHLTDDPFEWHVPDSTVYVAEYRGEVQREGNKIAALEARLLRLESWENHRVFTRGEHTISDGLYKASGSATVRAYDSATVRAYDSATVRASGSATVEAYGSATVISTRYHRNGIEVALSDLAAHIDRRNGKLVLRGARGEAMEVPA